ncbi:MAG: MBL fold metallo-hydrolase [Halobacteriovoraceae bacterium]|nr:MBL fold metallo-hydrolase [Halobacteriovoraceae bacterium]
MIEVNSLRIQEFFDQATYTLCYVVWDSETKDTVIIDSVLDFDQASGNYSYKFADNLIDFIKSEGLKVHYILETHAHADHLSASVYLKEKFPESKTGIGKNITIVQETFKALFNIELETRGYQFDKLFEEDEVVKAGSLEFKVLFTPGHTPACTSLLFEGAVFTGDALFMPDYGTGRCDFPKGSATDLYHSIQKLYALPDETLFFTGHDYQPGGRELKFHCTLKESKAENIRLKGDTTMEEFVKFRSERDATLSAPKLLLPSIQVNIDGGHFPKPEENGVSYLKTPLSEKS